MIDIEAIRLIASGDQSKKIAVSKRWLCAVADEIEQLRKNQKPPRNTIDDAVDKLLKMSTYGKHGK